MIKTLKKAITQQEKYTESIKELERKINDKCCFDAGIESIPGDGICVINTDNDQLARVRDCINVIQTKGTLTSEDHYDLAI